MTRLGSSSPSAPQPPPGSGRPCTSSSTPASAGRGAIRGMPSSSPCVWRAVVTCIWRPPSATWRSPARTMPTPTCSSCAWHRPWTACARQASTRGWYTWQPAAGCWPVSADSPTRCVRAWRSTAWCLPGRGRPIMACDRSSRSRPCRCASSSCLPVTRSAMGSASARPMRPGSPPWGSATETAGRGSMPTTGRCWCMGRVGRSWARSAWTASPSILARPMM